MNPIIALALLASLQKEVVLLEQELAAQTATVSSTQVLGDIAETSTYNPTEYINPKPVIGGEVLPVVATSAPIVENPPLSNDPANTCGPNGTQDNNLIAPDYSYNGELLYPIGGTICIVHRGTEAEVFYVTD